jgi:ABC-type spermidine/putrescine transport system permease subunit II
MAAISHHMKSDTSIINIVHCKKLIIAVSLGFLYKQFKNITKKTPWITLLSHIIMAAPLVKKLQTF